MKSTKDNVVIFRGKVHLYYSNKGQAFRHNLKIDEKNRNTRDNVKMINTQVEKLKSIIFDYNLEHSTNPPVDYIKSKFFTTETKGSDILEIYDNFIKEIEIESKNGSEIKKQSIEPYKAIKNNLTDYIAKFEYTNLDEKFIDDFIKFLYSNNYSYSIDTARKKSVYFRKFVKYLQKKKTINFIPIYAKPKRIIKNKHVETLTKEELNFLIDERTKTTKYKTCLDMFLFQCFTSLRYSDLIQISKDKIDKKDLLIIDSKKTGAEIHIYTNKLLNDILKENDYDFNKIPYFQYRFQLKEMLKDFAENDKKLPSLNESINLKKYMANETTSKKKCRHELMGSHTGRRTFITIQVRMNTSFADIMLMTGHKSLEILQEYLDIYKREKANETENLSNKIIEYLKTK